MTAKMDYQVNDRRALENTRSKLVDEKGKLATEVKRVENLLKIKMDSDKKNSHLLKKQIEMLNSQLKFNRDEKIRYEIKIK